MVYQSIQFNPFYLVSPGSYPLFTNISLFFDNLFIGLQNILSSFINNNLWYCYILLIFIFSILLTILLFILVIDRQKGYSVKMNNLPNNDNSKKRKRKSENGNSRKKGKGKSGNGDSDSPDKDGDKPKPITKPKLFLPKKDEETQAYECYMKKYDTSNKKNELSPIGTRKQVKDTFPSLYSEYKKHKPNNPDLEWEKLTEVFFSTWDRQPFGNRCYADTDRGFEQAWEYMKNKLHWIEMGLSKGKTLEASALWKKALSNVDFTTYEKYIKILDNVVNRRGR